MVEPQAPLAPGEYELSAELVVLSAPNSPPARAIDETATALVARHVDLGRRGLAVCGPAARAGVSYTAANLAVALAQAGVSTVLVDANLRGPALERFFRPAGPVTGLQQHLRSPQVDVEDIVHPEVLPNLSLVYSGGASLDAQELLTGERFRATLRECMRNYECTLVDTPPANRSSDALIVGAALGYAVMVARRSESFLEDVALFREQLETDGVLVVGSILNGA